MTIEITNEMVDRMCASIQKTGGVLAGPGRHGLAREWLNAALNPPKDSEIVVTEDMVNAGEQMALNRRMSVTRQRSTWQSSGVAYIYRAMRVLEPKRIQRSDVKDRRKNPYNAAYNMYPAPWEVRGDDGRHGPNSGHGRRSTDPYISDKWSTAQ